MERKTLLLLAILAGANAGPLNVRVEENNRKCSSVCPESTKFNYAQGTTYEFTYDSSTTTALTGASEEVSGLRITATADVEILDRCEFALKLSNVALEEVDPASPERRLRSAGSREFARMLESEPLRFSFQDGKVVELCPTESENWQSLNAKRGVLSAFQNSMDRLTEDKKTKETDVTGNCNVEYKVASNEWGTIKISKTKKILGCTDRHGKVTSFQATPYRVPSSIQSLPLMKSSHNCEQSFHTDGRLIETNCEEVHTFRPFSYGKGGATTVAKQNLKYKTYRRGTTTRQDFVGRRTDLLFEHAFEGERLEMDRNSVMAQLREICEVAKNDVRPEVPRMFANLVYKMRRLDTATLRQVWRYVSDDRRPFCSATNVARKYFMDAIPACGTIASVSMIQQLIASDDVSGTMATAWLNSLAFISQPSKEMISEIMPLVQVAKPSRQAMLTVSSLVNSYCRFNTECATESEVQAIIKVFEDNLGYDCRIKNKDDREKVLMSLKALGNTGRALKAADTLGRCISAKNQATDIRVAAIQAFRRLPCSFDKTKLMATFKDSEEDSEVRAHSYLAIMRCADKTIVNEVKMVLENEKSTQIGTFIWTHLTNLMETSDPFKWEIREILEDEELAKEFNNDVRKFSRNYEKSFFSQILNTGARAEGNVLFSDKSYVPRYAQLNLTLDMFGESLNFLDLEGRVEGMEYLVESFFGPNGYFQKNDVNELLSRKRRNIIRNADVDKMHTKFGAHMDDQTRGSASMKIFGNEIAFGEFIGFDPLNNKDSFNPLDILIKLASDQDIDFSKSAMFLDTSMVIPTMIGLPLNLTVNGTASVNIKIGGHADIRKLMTSPHDFDIDGHIKPSGAVELSSVMTVDAFVARAGVKMVTTVHTSTYVDGKISLKEGDFSVNLNTPKEKMEVMDVQSKFFIIHREEEREQKMITANRIEKEECTGDFLKSVLGIKLCGELQLPNAIRQSGAPFYPLTGPTKMSIILYKSDSMSGYQFNAKYQTEKSRKGGETHVNHIARLAFNTPGSKVDRNMAADFELNTGSMSSKVEIVSPWKKVSINGAIVKRDDLKRATLRMMVDETMEYALTAQLQNDVRRNLYTYKPNVEVRMPGREPITLIGSVEYQRNKHYAADLTLDKLFRHPVIIKTNVDPELSSSRQKVIASVELRNQLFDTKMSGQFDLKTGKTLSTRVELEYNRDGKPKQTFVFSQKARNLSPGAYSLDTTSTSDAYPEYNHQLSLAFNGNKKHVDVEVDLSYGDDFDNKDKKIFLTHTTDLSGKYPVGKVSSKSKLKVPAQDLTASYDLSYQLNNILNHEMTLTGRYNTERLSANFNLKDESTRRLMKYTSNGRIDSRKLKVSFEETFEQKSETDYSHDLSVVYKGDTYSLQGTYAPQELTGSANANIGGQQYSTEGKFTKQEGLFTVTGNTNIRGDRHSVEGKLVNNDQDKSALVSATLAGKAYSAEVKYSNNGRQITGDLDLVHPDRHIKGDINLTGRVPSNMRGQMSVSWDADRYPAKKMTVQANYADISDRSATKHTGSLMFNHPGHVAKLNLDFDSSAKSTVSAQWNREKIVGTGEFSLKTTGNVAVSGEFGITSTIKNLESLSLNFNHKKKGTTYKSGGEFSWSPSQKVGGDLELDYPSVKDIKSRLTISTPFRKIRSVSFMWNHKLDDKNMQAHAQATADRRNYEITVGGTDLSQPRRPRFEGNVNIKTPFASLEDVSAKFAHTHDPRRIVSSLEATLAPRNVVSFSINGQDRSRNGRNFQGTVELKTPWENARDLSASFEHNDDGSTQLTNKMITKWDSKKQIEVEVNIQNRSNTARDAITTITVKTPFTGYTDMSLTADHKDNGRQFDTSLSAKKESEELAGFKFTMRHYGRNLNINNQGSLDITTPISYYRNINYNWNHQQSSGRVNTNFNIEWPYNKKVSLTVSGVHNLDSRRTITANVGLKTPFEPVEDVAFSLSHNNGDRDFETEANVQLTPRKNIKVNVDLSNVNPKDLTANFKLETPYYDEINSMVSVKTSRQPMKAHAEFNWEPTKKIAIDGSLNTQNTFNGDLRLTTPFENFERIMMTASHDNNRGTYESAATFEYAPRKKFDLSSKINTEGQVKVNLDFKIPCPEVKTVVFNLEHTGDITSFSNKMDFESQPNLGKFTTDVFLNTNRKFEARATVTTPFEEYKEYSTSVTHNVGRDNRMVTVASVNWPSRQMIRLNSDMTLNGLTNCNGAISLTTPFKYLEMTKVNFNHNGDLSDLTTHVDTEYMRGQKLSTDITFKNMNDEIKGSATVNTPFQDWEQTRLTFQHNGVLKNFRSSADLAYGSDKIETSVSFSGEDSRRIDFTFGLKTPFDNVEDINLAYKHQGDWKRRFTCTYDIGYAPGKKIELQTITDLRRDISVDLTFKSPFEKLEDISASFKHAGKIANFKTNAEVMYAPSRKVKGEVAFNMEDNIKGSLKLKSPFENFENIQASFSHGGVLKNFNTHAEVSYAPKAKIEGDINFDASRNIQGSIQLKTPFDKFEDISAQFKHSGGLKNFNTHAEVSYEPNEKFEGDINFDARTNIQGSIELKTPFIEDISAQFKHSGELKNFNTHAEVSYAPESKIEGDITFDATKSIQGSIGLKTPFDKFEDISAQFKHSGELKNFKSHVECTYAPRMKVEGDVAFALADKEITGSASFKSPFENFEEVTGGFTHKGNGANFRTQGNVQYSPRDKMDFDVNFKNNRRGIQGSVMARTPFENFRRQSASFNKMAGTAHAEVTYLRNQKIEVDVAYPSWTDISTTVKTPFRGFEDIGAAYKLTGDYNKEGHAEVTYMTGMKIEADATYKYQTRRNNYKLDSTLVIKTPFQGYEEMGGKTTYNGYPLNFVAHMDVYYPSKKYELDVENNIADELNKKVLVTLRTPHENFEEMKYDMKVTGPTTNFHKHTEITYYGGKMIINDVTFKKDGYNMEVTYAHQSPYWDDFTANWKYTGYPQDFTNHVDITYAEGQTIENDITFSLKNGVQTTVSLKTPFENYEDMSVIINHKGNSWKSIASSAVVKYNVRDTISASTTFSLSSNRLMANVDFSSPFKNLESLSAEVNHNGDLSAFRTNAGVTYARGKKIQISADLKNRDITRGSMGTITLNTPFRMFENLQMVVKSQLNGEEYASNGIFTWARGKSVNIDTVYLNNGDFFGRKNFKLHVTGTNTHMRDLSLAWKLDHTHVWKRMVNSHAVASLSGEVYMDVTANYRNARNTHTGSITLDRPNPMKAEVSASIDGGKMAGSILANWNTEDRDSNVRLTLDTNNQGSEKQIKRDSMFKIITPRRTVIIEHDIEVSANVINHKIVYCWDDARDKKIAHEFSIVKQDTNLETSNKIVSPWRSMKLTTTTAVNKLKSNADISIFWDADRDDSKKLTVQGTHERRGQILNQELVIMHPNLSPAIKIQNEVNIGDANTIYSTNTQIDYSGDRRKKLTVSTNIRKESVRSTGTNYTMQVDITHPASYLDISAITQLGNSDRSWSAGIGMDYTTAKSRDKKSMLLRTEIKKLRNEVELQLLTPVFHVNNWMKMKDLSNKKFCVYHFEMRNTLNAKTVSSSMDVDQKARKVDLKVSYDPENPLNVLHAIAKFNNDSAVSAEVYRMHDNVHITEGLITARLNNSRLMHTRLHWTPSLVLDVKDGYYAMKEKLHPDSAMWSEMADEASDRWRRSASIVKAESNKMMKKLALDKEINALDDDWNMFVGEMGNMIRRNEFFSRDAITKATEFYTYSTDKIAELKTQMAELRVDLEQTLNERLGEIEMKFNAYYQEMSVMMVELSAQAEAKVAELKEEAQMKLQELKEQAAVVIEDAVVELSNRMEPLVIKYVELYNIAEMKVQELTNIMNAKYEEIMMKVRNTRAYQNAMMKLDELMEKYDALLSHDYAQYIPDMSQMDFEYINTAKSFVNDKAAQYTSAIYGVHSQLNGQVQELLNRAEVQAMKKYANMAVDHGKWAYDNYEIEKHAKDIYHSAIEELKDMIEDNAKYIAEEYLRIGDTKYTVYNPQNGEIQAEIGLPVPWESFVTLPQYEQLLAKIMAMKRRMRLPSAFDYSFGLDQNTVMDYFYQYKPTRDYRNWIPPFKAYATISHQHITTFDNRYYEFAGTCSYLLAHDFIDGNFSVIVNYGRKGKSLLVLANDKEIQMLPDFTIRLNGKKIDMPVQFANTTIMRLGNAVRVHNTNGVTVTCDTVHDVCTTNMTGWYFGKTAGLFGTYDNEASNDFTMVNNRQGADTLEFTKSWSLRCSKHRNNANINKPDTTTEAHRTCAALFNNEQSVLRHCFKIVDPANFYAMCYNDLSSSKKNTDDETQSCNVAANYIQECKQHDVYLRLPRTCIKCETGDKKKKTVIEGEEFTFSKEGLKTPQSADVVIVVEEKKCNKKASKRMFEIVKNIDISLKKNGMKYNRFGLVGFGGEGVHNYEHPHTMDGQMFNTARYFKMGSATLDFSEDGTNSDVLRAIHLANKYPFRAGVAKTIVVIPCSACDEDAVKYSEIQQLLFEQNTQLHVIAKNDFSIKGKVSYNWYGLDVERVYTNKDSKKIVGDASLRKHINVPKDLCAALALETKGSVFNLNILSQRASILKKMIYVFGKRVAKTAVPEKCQVCQCMSDELGVGMSHCRSCERPVFTSYLSEIMGKDVDSEESGAGPTYIVTEDVITAKKEKKARKIKTPKA